MRDLSTSSEHFISTCIALFTRMMETVPAAIKLTDIVAPLEIKPVNVTLDFTPGGTLIFKGFVRVSKFAERARRSLTMSTYKLLSSNTLPNNAIVAVLWNARNRSSNIFSTPARFKSSQVGGSVWGRTSFYSFEAPVDPDVGISTFSIRVDGKIHDNGGNGYPMQDIAFVVPSLSDVEDNGKFSVTAAVLRPLSVKSVHADVAFPAEQQGALEGATELSAMSYNYGILHH
ncbi:hypothetical protein PQX77_001310 [Marasmius sp. AFHP31]|nr:hypothetical protein PQX77_001310 [Marasmius sp. AFHP31]